MSIPATGNLIDVYRLPDFDLQATPEAPFGISCRPEKNGCGSGSFTIPLDDPAYALIAINDVAAIRRDGDTIFSFVVEVIDEHTLDSNEGSHRTATYSGRGVGCFLEWWVVAPQLGELAKPIEDDSIFDSSSLRYDPADDSWVNATEIMSVTAAKAGGWPTQPMGEDFTDSTGAFMIWDASGDDTTAPGGWDLFYEDVTVSSSEAGRYVLECLMDNDGYARVDTVEMLHINQNDGYHRVSFKAFDLSEGTHRLWFQVRNFDGPGALAYNLFKADQQNHPMPGVAVKAISSDSTKVLAYPDPFPGMTVGDIVGVHLLDDEAQGDRGVAPWLVPSFDKDDDSNGDPFDREVGITTKTGTTTGLQFMDELVAAGRIAQWKVRNDGVTFDIFAPGYTNPTAVTLDPAPVDDPRTGQLVQLDRKIT